MFTVADIHGAEQDRRLMCDELSASTNGRTAADLLSQLDEECERREQCESASDIEMGPFGAFRSRTLPVEASSIARSSSTPDETFFLAEDESVEDIPRDGNSMDLNSLNFDGLNDYNGFDLMEATNTFGSFGNINGSWAPLGGEFAGFDPFAVLESPYSRPSFGNFDAFSAQDAMRIRLPSPVIFDTIPRALSPNLSGDSGFQVQEAADLLRYYKEKVIRVPSGSSTRRKSPWEILVMPSAMQTFAEMSVFNTASPARLATLHALLANSAFHLHASDKGGQASHRWLQAGVKAQRVAKERLKNALELDTGQGDYKEVLMAILAMVMVSVSRIIGFRMSR